MNCILVDDEYPSIEELSYFITNFSSIKIIGKFDDSIKALEYVQNHSVDVIFLDINMPRLDGMAFSRVINAYVEIEKARFGEKLNIYYDIDDT
ncbi:MAG: response regulator, partial [Pseudomonadota bacterium]